jgi:hypothetical protein
MKSSIFWDITQCRMCGSHSGGYEEFYLLAYNVPVACSETTDLSEEYVVSIFKVE